MLPAGCSFSDQATRVESQGLVLGIVEYGQEAEVLQVVVDKGFVCHAISATTATEDPDGQRLFSL